MAEKIFTFEKDSDDDEDTVFGEFTLEMKEVGIKLEVGLSFTRKDVQHCIKTGNFPREQPEERNNFNIVELDDNIFTISTWGEDCTRPMAFSLDFSDSECERFLEMLKAQFTGPWRGEDDSDSD